MFKRAKIYLTHNFSSYSLTVVICFLVWIVITAIPNSHLYFPSPLEILRALINNENILFRHLTSTVTSALVGFIFGIIAAVLSSFIVIFWHRIGKILNLFSIALYSIPLIAAAPLAALIFGASNTGIVLGFMGSYLPVFISGLRHGTHISKNLKDLIKGYGATKFNEIRFIRLPLMIRGWIIGAQTGWIWAVLGSLLGDFTGSRWGLGTFLLGSLVHGDRGNVWAIVFLCLSISFIGLIIIKKIGKLLILNSSFDPIDLLIPVIEKSKKNATDNILTFFTLILLWQFTSWLLNISGGVFASPLDIISLTFDIFNGQSSLSFQYLFSAVANTWSVAFIGVLFSLFLAFIIASGQIIFPILSRPIVLIILITQVTPIVAFVPLIAFYLDRGHASIISIVVASTIYPAYTVFIRSFEGVSKNAMDIVKGFGASGFSLFLKVQLPNAAMMTIVAIRLAVGRAILGAVTAEYLLTGTGLGGILGHTRSLLDFRIVWLICIIIGIATLLTDLFILIIRKSIQLIHKSATIF